MPDDRLLERMFERALEAIENCSKQIGRMAFAMEAMVMEDIDEHDVEKSPCRACGSHLVPVKADECFACGTPKEKKADA